MRLIFPLFLPQIHPHGWCALSRNISYDESTEFTCLHDIQHRDYDESVDSVECDNTEQKLIESSDEPDSSSDNANRPMEIDSPQSPQTNDESALNLSTATAASHTTHPDIWAAEVTLRDRLLGVRRNRSATFGNTHVYGISSGVLSMPQASSNQPVRLPQANGYRYMYVPKKSIPQNVRRMLYSIEQPNKGQGLIKEECFSSCGRLICSPYGFGFRLLSFSPDCLELPNALSYQKESHKLTELKYVKCHQDIVVSTRFSPIQPLLASGCLQGRIIWHQPRF